MPCGSRERVSERERETEPLAAAVTGQQAGRQRYKVGVACRDRGGYMQTVEAVMWCESIDDAVDSVSGCVCLV